MRRLIKSSPWTCDVEIVEELILYDNLVAARLRISIVNAEPEILTFLVHADETVWTIIH